MSLSYLSALARAKVNGTHRSPTAEHIKNKSNNKRKKQTMERSGAAVTAHPALKAAVAKLCCVREATLGKVTKMRRDLLAVDTKAARAHAAAHHQDEIVENERLATARATKLNAQVETDLITTTQELDDTLQELGMGAIRKVLSAQINK